MSHVPSTMYGWKEAHQNYNPGASLRGWRDFFVNGQIVDHQSLIQKYHQAETKAEDWIKEDYK